MNTCTVERINDSLKQLETIAAIVEPFNPSVSYAIRNQIIDIKDSLILDMLDMEVNK